jgi:hypothetical protein
MLLKYTYIKYTQHIHNKKSKQKKTTYLDFSYPYGIYSECEEAKEAAFRMILFPKLLSKNIKVDITTGLN